MPTEDGSADPGRSVAVVPLDVGSLAPVSPLTRQWMGEVARVGGRGSDEVPAAVKQEAEKALRHLDARLMPGSKRDWSLFLAPLVLQCMNAPAKSVLSAWLDSAVLALRPIPRELLTEERQAEALRRFHYFPTPARLFEWLDPIARPLRAERSALSVLAHARPRPARPAAADDGPFDRSQADRLIAELRANERDRRADAMTRLGAKPLPTERLRLICERDLESALGRGDVERAAALRRRLAALENPGSGSAPSG